MQGRNRDRDIENGHVDSRGDGEVRTNWGNSVDVSRLGFPGDRWRVGSCSIAHGVQLRCSVMTYRRGMGVGGRSRGRGHNVYM